MTSPVGGKPKNKNEKYDEVYSRGSTYGSDLRTRKDVERLLLRKPQSAFGKFLSGIANGFNQFVNDLAEVFRGNGGAKYEVLKVAVDERFKTEINGVTEAVDRAQAAIDEANTALVEQGKLTKQQKRDLESAKADLGKAGRDAREALAALSKLEGETSSIREALSKKIGNDELSRVSRDLDAARQRAGKLSDDLEKLSHSVDSGAEGSGSIITFNADGVPHWFSENQGAARGFFGGSDKLYPGAKHVLSKTDISRASYDYYGSDHYVRVHKGIPYRWSAWVYVTKPSNIGVTFRAGKDSAPCIGTHFLMDYNKEASPIATLGPYGFGVRVKTVNKWVRVSGSLVFEEEHDFVTLRQLEWNWGVSKGASIKQAVGDISVVPVLDDGAPLGGSLIPYQPGTSEPLWWSAAKQGMAKSYPDSHSDWSFPDGHQWRTSEQAGTRAAPWCTKKLVKVIPGVDYTFKFWTKATEPGSRLYIEFRNQNDELCVESGGLGGSGRLYPVGDLTVSKNREHHVTTKLRFTADTREVWLGRFFFNHSSGAVANQWIAGIECYPSVVDQAMIDRLQFEAIRKNEVVGSSNKSAIAVLEDTAANQAKWNETQRIVNEKQAGWNAAQSVVNSKQGLWNNAATNALKALEKITGYTNLGSSCVPLIPGTTTPAWTTALVTRKVSGFSHKCIPNGTVDVKDKTVVAIDPSIEYDFGGYMSLLSGSRAYIKIYFENEKGARVAPTCWKVLSNGKKALQASTGSLSINLSSSAPKFSYVLKFPYETKFIRISAFSSNSDVAVSEINFTPHFVPQAEIDKAQDTAIKALGKAQAVEKSTANEFRKKQTAINELGERIDAAQNKSLQIHQDTMELLDIRMPKTFYMQSGKWEGNYDPSTGKAHYPPRNYGWFQVNEDESRRKVTVVCKGKWTGKLVFVSNWSNGAADNWVVDVTPTERGFVFTGGAAHITCRGYEFTVFPECLNRQCKYKPGNSPVLEDNGSLVRERRGDKFLFKGPVTFNNRVAVLKGPTDSVDRWVDPGTVVQGEWVQLITWNYWYVVTEHNVSQDTFKGLDTSYPSNVTYTDPRNAGDWGSSGWNSSDWNSSGWGSSGWGSS